MFDEKKHPRDNDGKFTDGSKTYRQNTDYADILAENNRESQSENKSLKKQNKKAKSRDEFFGEEFKGYKGKKAIEKLLKEKRGHIKNAFERPEIGGIDLVWGDDSGGLLHTIARRDKMLERGTGHISGIDMVEKIPDIVENGEFNIDEKDRPGFNYDGYRVAVRPTFNGEKLNWVVSAMEKF